MRELTKNELHTLGRALGLQHIEQLRPGHGVLTSVDDRQFDRAVEEGLMRRERATDHFVTYRVTQLGAWVINHSWSEK